MDFIITQLKNLALSLPLELSAFIGSFIEEIFSPIPSPLILITAGTIAKTRALSFLYILLLAALASIGKTLGSLLYFLIADKTENLLLKKFGKYLQISEKDIKNLSSFFDGTYKDDLIIFVLRAFPPAPTTLVSFACGFLKINKKAFIRSTFLGYFVRSFIFIYLGYSGLTTYEKFSSQNFGLSTFLQIVLFVLFSLSTFWFFTPSGKRFIEKLVSQNKPR